MKFFSAYGNYHGKEKLRVLSWYSGLHPAIKRKVIMRINFVAFLLFMSLINAHAATYAQSVTLSVRNKPLIEVLNEINKQTGYELIYNTRHFAAANNVTLTVKSKSLVETLDKCFAGQPLQYEIIDKTIVIKPKAPTSKEKVKGTLKKILITGKVLDESGKPLSGVNVSVKATNIKTSTDEQGTFSIDVPDIGTVLRFSFVGFQIFEHTVINSSPLSIKLRQEFAQLEEVGIISTGYQSLPKERATGSFVQIDNELLNRRTSTYILERLDGITSGFLFNGTASKNIRNLPTTNRNLGISIRGESTILGAKDPLIVVDNFPYDGDIRNINPNDVESVTVLKDAAAASIWGARAGNGVIVITTKKGKINEKMQVELNTNLTVANEPNLFADKNFMSSMEFIEAEKFLFDKGYFNSDISNNTAMTAVSPVVDILSLQRSGLISAVETETRLDLLRNSDVRNDFENYVYQKAVSQQYSLGARGGGANSTYALSIGYDQNTDAVKRNGYNRITINSFNTYTPAKNLEVSAGLNYSLNNTLLNNTTNLFGTTFSMTPRYNRIFPYSSLRDENGSNSILLRSFKPSYLEQAAAKGFLDWAYRPLDEIAYADNSTKIRALLFRVGAKYNIGSNFNAEVNFQSDQQTIAGRNYQSQLTYYTRDLINKFSQIDPTTKTLNYIFPLGGIMTTNNNDWRTNSLRGQINYSETFQQHQVVALVGAEVRETKATGVGRTSYGYDEQFGTSIMNLNYTTSYPANPSGTARIASPDGSINTYLNRFISYYANVAYVFRHRYTLNLSARKDGSNIFGASANNRITPLWSVGTSWAIDKEDFYKLVWLPYLKLRATFGYNGNIGNAIALLTGRYATNNITGQQYLNILTAPNPELRWERVRNINLGLDFKSQSDILSGTLEFFRKDGVDLLQPTPLAAQTGFLTYTGNAASTRTSGIDFTLQSRNINSLFKWNTSLLLSRIVDKVRRYDVKQTSTSIQTTGAPVALIGKPMYSIFSYKWTGLDPLNGDPQGYLNGVMSKDYAAIINNFSPDSLIFHGSARPTVFGSLRNDFYYKGFSLSVNVVYKFGYYIRKPTISLNYSDIVSQNRNTDYGSRWKVPGDELHTNIPSIVYPSNSARNNFYQYSESLVQRGDHVRLQDISLGYLVPQKLIKGINRIQLYAYLNNIGILWRKNDSGIDPDSYSTGGASVFPNPLSISFGVNANF
ncbi:SusC/RagA family TonB-linked outer membrane protein [Taibaiella chishuiensis]|uniref:TonB-linked SusC/RagA family outer membrane protein n=1 Tax=Taibaiella chishuiensis TaxID=1434707 RepID=A0A2P8D0Q7_9BACT|nr:SusC/RagA family TonB-linked outer membrane protein [Taibaiella chishuiensis]PSK90803.1 TonB-linked SusC/RagA family outer membrane protein [Taibaiella chishuiensis]